MRKIISILLCAFCASTLWGTPFFYSVDLSNFANASMESAGLTLKCTDENFGLKEFEKVPFSIINPNSNVGNAVLAFSEDAVTEVSVPLKNFNYEGNANVYILCNAKSNSLFRKPKGILRVSILDGNGKWVSGAKLQVGESIGYKRKKSFESCIKVKSPNFIEGSLFMCSFTIPKPWKGGVVPTTLNFKLDNGGVVNILGVSIATRSVTTVKTKKYKKSEWKAVDTSSLLIKSGSALDVSKFIIHKPAGKFGRLVVSKDGHFEFEKQPNVRVKFKSTNWRPAQNFTDSLATKEQIDAIISQAGAQGYNMIRWRVSPERKHMMESDYKYKADVQDKLDYFLFACSREGIYSHIMLCSHLFGEMSQEWKDRYDIKIKFLFADEKTLDGWKRSVRELLEHVNPYTGKAWKDDASIATVECFNELDQVFSFAPLQGLSPAVMKYAENKIREFLKNKYKEIDVLNEAWKCEKKFASFDEINPLSNRDHFLLCESDFNQIIIEQSRVVGKICKDFLRNEMNYHAPMHQYNFVFRLGTTQAGYEWGEYMGVNTYAAHVSGGFTAGAKVNQDDWLSEDYAGAWFLGAISKRVAGMPFFVTEYQQCHWNPYKYTAGVFFPAYSAFQDFDVLTIHDRALSDKPYHYLAVFESDSSPVFRANEFLSFCLFYRGDVSPAKSRVEVVYDKTFMDKYAGRCAGVEQMKTAYMTGLSVSFPDSSRGVMKNVRAADLVQPADGCCAPTVKQHGILPQEPTKNTCADTAKVLREKGLLSVENISDPANGVFQSDTGEITMRLKDNFIKVVTPKTEAVAMRPSFGKVELGNLKVNSVSYPCAVAVCSVDDNSIAQSGRMVLVLNTDNISDGFKIVRKDSSLIRHGSKQALVRVCKLSAELKLKPNTKFDIYALNITGERLEKLSVPIENGIAKIEIDTAKLENEPSVFFEIVEAQ